MQRNFFLKCMTLQKMSASPPPPHTPFPFSKFPQNMWVRYETSYILEQLSHSQSVQTATLIIVWHKWQTRSREINMRAFNFRPSPWNYWPAISQAVPKALFFEPNPNRTKTTRFPDARCFGDDGLTLNSTSRPLPTHPRVTYFREGNPRCQCMAQDLLEAHLGLNRSREIALKSDTDT